MASQDVGWHEWQDTLCSVAAGGIGVRGAWHALCVCSVAGWGLITEGGGGAEEAHFSNMVIR